MSSLIESIIDDYDGYGYGEKVDDSTIKSLSDDTTVILEAVYEDDDIVGITVYSNNIEVDTISYDDANFTTRLSTILAEELNV